MLESEIPHAEAVTTLAERILALRPSLRDAPATKEDMALTKRCAKHLNDVDRTR